MADQMLSRRGQRLSRFVAKPSFAGRGLVERMRTTVFALLGVTTAMALGLVAVVSQQSWPYLPFGPIPSYQAEHGRLDSAIALAPAAAGLGISSSDASTHRVLVGSPPVVAGSNESRLSGSHGVASQPAAPDTGQPDGEGAPASAPGVAPPDQTPDQPPAPAPVPASPAPAPPPSTPTTPSPSPAPAPPSVAVSNPGKGHAYGKQKAPAAPKPKPSHTTPTATSPPAEPAVEPDPPPTEAAPPAPAIGASDGPGNGHGHAYGHEK